VMMGKEAFNLIIDMINKKAVRNVDNKKVILEPLLQPRASSQR
jgi:hypothetical protein